jgi:ribosomal protein S18 acetylase RimI-like enzyme
MDVTESLQFTHRGRKDIYEYVERHGTVRPVEVRRALNLDPGEFGHHLTLLKRDGYLREDEDDRLQVAFRESAAEAYESDGLAFTVRQAHQGDIDGLSEVVRTVAEEGSYIEAETVADVIDHERVVTRHNQVRSRLFFVATVGEDGGSGSGADADADANGVIVGWVHLDMPEAEKLAHTAVLTVGIDPDYRGHGVGSALLQRGMDWARERGFEKLYNSIPSTNEGAIAFLEEHGWVTEAVRHDHYRVDDEYADEVMMAVELR